MLEQRTQVLKRWLTRVASKRPPAVICLIVISLVAFLVASLASIPRSQDANSLKANRDCIVQSMKDKPQTAAGHYLLALLNMQIEDYPQAKIELTRAIQMDPGAGFVGGIEAAKELDRSLDKKINKSALYEWIFCVFLVVALVIAGVALRRKAR